MNLFTTFFYLICLIFCGDCLAELTPDTHCMDLNPQRYIDINHLLGTWYGSEILRHSDGYNGTSENECVEVHLSDITHETSTFKPQRTDVDGLYEFATRHFNYDGSLNYQYLKLRWIEENANVEYTLQFNTTKRSFWTMKAPKKGAVNLPDNQFTGTIQVMKAVENTLVLTFCQTAEENELFSIILTRHPNSLMEDDISSVRRLLQRRGLNIAQIRKVCSRSGSSSNSALSIVALTLAILCVYLF